MKTYYYKNSKVKEGDKITIGDINVKITRDFIINNPKLFMDIDARYVKCIHWAGSLFKEGDVYEVEDGNIINEIKGVYKLIMYHHHFIKAELKDFNTDELDRHINSYPEYVQIKFDVDQNTNRWARSEPGKIYKVLDYKTCDDVNEKCFYVSDTTCILPIDCIPATKLEYCWQQTNIEVNKRYKVGDVVKSLSLTKKAQKILSLDILHQIPFANGIWVKGEICNIKLFDNNAWTEILEPLEKTLDEETLYEGDQYYEITENFDIEQKNITKNNISTNKKFCSLSNAQFWVSQNKPKTLEDYEMLLLVQDSDSDDISQWDAYNWLKQNEPRLYWIKVLDLIAKDLNTPSNMYGCKYVIAQLKDGKAIIQYCSPLIKSSAITFNNGNLAQKAIDIFKDKIKFIFPND